MRPKHPEWVECFLFLDHSGRVEAIGSFFRSTMGALLQVLLAVSLLSQPVDRLILRTGEQIPIRGDITVSGGVVLFESEGGTLYSIPTHEIDFEATDQLARLEQSGSLAPPPRSLRVSEEEKQRLLREISENHRGVPTPSQDWESAKPEPARTRAEDTPKQSQDEWHWKNLARQHEESLRAADEELTLLVKTESDLERQVLGFLSLGYQPNQFSYQVLRLQTTRDSMDRARLEVERARRRLDQFRDDARRQGILPGWLR